MKKDEFIEKVLSDDENTVFVNEDQVKNALGLFEKLGMKPPQIESVYKKYGAAVYIENNYWEDEKQLTKK